MAELADFLAVIGDMEMQRRELIASNERLASIARALISGALLPGDVNPETFEITAATNGRSKEPASDEGARA